MIVVNSKVKQAPKACPFGFPRHVRQSSKSSSSKVADVNEIEIEETHVRKNRRALLYISPMNSENIRAMNGTR